MARILVISGHDYRSRRRASIHFIVDQWAKDHEVRFYSTGFSLLSMIKRDPRANLFLRGNKVEVHRQVECYLQRSWVHPVALPKAVGRFVNRIWLSIYRLRTPRLLKRWIALSDIIVIDAGLAINILPILSHLGSSAKLLYHASDMLASIGCAPELGVILSKHYKKLSGTRVPSKHFFSAEEISGNALFIPQAIDDACALAHFKPSPYKPGIHAVSVGSMLFDPFIIDRIAESFPDITIHVIGAGRSASKLSRDNIVIYPEMPFDKTQAYIFHANLGIAAYELSRATPYLADSSLKLAQYDFHGIPSVCPDVATGGLPSRFGYTDKSTSLDQAVKKALGKGRFEAAVRHEWKDTARAFISMAF